MQCYFAYDRDNYHVTKHWIVQKNGTKKLFQYVHVIAIALNMRIMKLDSIFENSPFPCQRCQVGQPVNSLFLPWISRGYSYRQALSL